MAARLGLVRKLPRWTHYPRGSQLPRWTLVKIAKLQASVGVKRPPDVKQYSRTHPWLLQLVKAARGCKWSR